MNNNQTELTVPKPPFLGGGNWILKNITPITIIFGKNGSGKSVLLRQIRDQDRKNRSYCVPERAGDIEFNANYVAGELDIEQRANRSSQNLSSTYRAEVIARLSAFLQKRGTHKKIDDSALTKIQDSINELLSDFKFNITGDFPPYSLKRLLSQESIIHVDKLSSGEAQVFTLALDLLLQCNLWGYSKTEGMLLIDEPDTHIHPDLQQRFAKFLIGLYETHQFQMIISTHSISLLAALGQFGGNLISIIYLNNSEEQNAIHYDKYLRTISTCLGGHILMGPLFGSPILLVEGDDDLRIWSEIPRYGTIKVAVISCNGEEIHQYQKALEKLSSSLLNESTKPVGYALLDGDNKKPTIKQDFIKYINLACRESENLYLTNEILAIFNLNWDAACEKIIQESANFGEKAESLKKIKSMNRKTDDFKPIINQIATILDDKGLAWSHRLGRTLGNNNPSGQLAEFLGKEVLESIWETR
ncbi:MAG: ATP-dependent nuclease [Nitrosopumilaceae archaeon]